MELINARREQYSGMIIVTHIEVTESFSRFFVEKEFGKQEYFYDRVNKGDVVHMNLEDKTYQILPAF